MKKTRQYVFLSVFLIVAYLLNACSAAPAGTQPLSDDQNSSVTAVGSQFSGADDVNDNSVVDNANETNTNDDNVNDDAANSNDDQNENSNADDDNGNGNENVNDNGDDNQGEDINDDQEVTGTVEAITADSITINGVTYMIADFTEFNDVISAGDQVKIHVIVNADGTFTISEIEITDETSMDDGNANANDNGNDDDQGVSSNDNGNNDDQGDDNQGDDNSGSDDGGGDDGGDDGGNSNGDD
jgi:hypothetical protein